jgi:hypothetical protein
VAKHPIEDHSIVIGSNLINTFIPPGDTVFLLSSTTISHELAADGRPFVLKLPGVKVVLVCDSYDPSGGGIDVSGNPGTAGSPGSRGGPGAGGAGTSGTDGGQILLLAKGIVSNPILLATGGEGGAGGDGGAGGFGGDDPDTPTAGGIGGAGGTGGPGGSGGFIEIFFVDDNPVTSNLVQDHEALLPAGGRGGRGGAGGRGGRGGAGGNGGPGGQGGPVGEGGPGGSGGDLVVSQETLDDYNARVDDARNEAGAG